MCDWDIVRKILKQWSIVIAWSIVILAIVTTSAYLLEQGRLYGNPYLKYVALFITVFPFLLFVFVIEYKMRKAFPLVYNDSKEKIIKKNEAI